MEVLLKYQADSFEHTYIADEMAPINDTVVFKNVL
jgi:hypothetical protein